MRAISFLSLLAISAFASVSTFSIPDFQNAASFFKSQVDFFKSDFAYSNDTLTDSNTDQASSLDVDGDPNAYYERPLTVARSILHGGGPSNEANGDLSFAAISIRAPVKLDFASPVRIIVVIQRQTGSLAEVHNSNSSPYDWRGWEQRDPRRQTMMPTFHYDIDVRVKLAEAVQTLRSVGYWMDWKSAALAKFKEEPGAEGTGRLSREPWWSLEGLDGKLDHFVNAKTGRVVGPGYWGGGLVAGNNTTTSGRLGVVSEA